MPLKPGIKNMRSNFNILVNEPVVSVSREKALRTIAESRNISYDEAKNIQALAIVKATARKK